LILYVPPLGPVCSRACEGFFSFNDDQQQKQLVDGIMVLFIIASFSFMFGKLESFSCETKEILLSSLWTRHLFGLAGLFSVLVVFTRSKPIVSPPILVAATFGLYALFLIACRCDGRFLALVLAAIVMVMYLEAELCWLHKKVNTEGDKEGDKERRKSQIKRAQGWIEVGVLVALVVGCLVYIGQHAREFRGQTWSWMAFWIGSAACSGDGSPCAGKECSVASDVYDGIRRVVGVQPDPRKNAKR